MQTLLFFLLGLAALLFAVKMIYVLSTAMVIRSTRGALYVSTTRKRIAACLDTISAQKGSTWIDLGCGDGRVLRQAWKRYKKRVKHTLDASCQSPPVNSFLFSLNVDTRHLTPEAISLSTLNIK